MTITTTTVPCFGGKEVGTKGSRYTTFVLMESNAFMQVEIHTIHDSQPDKTCTNDIYKSTKISVPPPPSALQHDDMSYCPDTHLQPVRWTS